MRHPFSRPAVLMTTVAMALLAAGCTGTPASQSSANANEPVTITFWHGWSAPSEVEGDPGQHRRPSRRRTPTSREGRRQHHRRQDQPGPAAGGGNGTRRGVVVHHRQRRASSATRRLRRPRTRSCRSRASTQNDVLRQADARVHPVPGQPVHAAAAGRRLRPLLQQGRVRGGRHHRAAEDLVGVRRPTRSSSPSPRATPTPSSASCRTTTATSHDHRHYAAQCVADVLHSRRQVQRRQRPRASPRSSSGRRTWSTSSAATPSWRSTAPTFGDEFGAKNPFETGQVAMQHRRRVARSA